MVSQNPPTEWEGRLTNVSPNPLTNLEQTIRAHWLEFRPKMCADLEAEGKLDAAIDAAARRTSDAVLDLVGKGTPLLFAWEQLREEWAILPAEEDEEETLMDVEPDDDDDDEDEDNADDEDDDGAEVLHEL
jgi:hypothetical protein